MSARGHAGQLVVGTVVEPRDDVDGDAHEERLEHAVPPGVLVEVSGGERAERGGDEARVVRAQRVGDELEADVDDRRGGRRRARR